MPHPVRKRGHRIEFGGTTGLLLSSWRAPATRMHGNITDQSQIQPAPPATIWVRHRDDGPRWDRRIHPLPMAGIGTGVAANETSAAETFSKALVEFWYQDTKIVIGPNRWAVLDDVKHLLSTGPFQLPYGFDSLTSLIEELERRSPRSSIRYVSYFIWITYDGGEQA